MGHTGAHGHTDHTDEPHNHPNPPRPTHPHDSATTESAADSTAAAPEPTASRGRIRRGRPLRTRPCRHPLPERLPAPARRPVGANGRSGPRARGVRWSGGRPRAPAVRDRETYLACCSHRLVAYTAYLTAYKQVLFSFTLNELSLKAHSHRHTRPAPSTSHHFACLVRTDRATVGVGRGQCIPRTHARTDRSA